MKKINLFLTALLLPFMVMAQANYHAGYVLKANGDTVNGYINYRNWAQNPKKIEFKVQPEDPDAIKFATDDLKEFVISGLEKYIKYTGPVSTDKNKFPDIATVLDTSKIIDTVLLREIYRGDNASLFTYTDNVKERFFVAESGNAPVELEYHQYYNDDNTAAIKVEKYKKQLYNIKTKQGYVDAKFTAALTRSSYNETDLINIFNVINNGADKDLTKAKKAGGWFYIGAGIERTHTSSSFDYNAVVFNSIDYLPRINFGFEVSNNPQVQRFIFRGELSLWYTNPTFIMPVNNTTETYSFKQFTLTITPQLLWNVYNTDKLKCFVGGGVGFNFSKYESSTIKNLPESRWANFPFTTGVVLNKKIEFAITYTAATVYSRYVGLYFENQTTTLGVKYRLGKN